MEKKKWTPQQLESWKKTKEKGVETYQANLKKKRESQKEEVVTPLIFSKQTPINKRSKKRAAQERKYNKLAAELKKLPENEICQWPGCEAPTVDCHHSGGKVGDLLLDQTKFIFLCRLHHIHAELNPIEAKEVGVSISRIEKVK